MARLDSTTAWEWLQRDLDGDLSPLEKAELDKALAADPALAREKRELERLGPFLASDRVPVTPGFAAQVMRSLPAAGWEGRHPKSWRLAVAFLLLLGGAAAALVGASGARLAPAGPFGNALLAVSDLFETAALTGAGLLAASWKGLGLVLGSALSGFGLVAFAAVVVGINLGLFLLVRRSGRRLAPQSAGISSTSSTDRG
jgi:anti-sigma factor RsiW